MKGGLELYTQGDKLLCYQKCAQQSIFPSKPVGLDFNQACWAIREKKRAGVPRALKNEQPWCHINPQLSFPSLNSNVGRALGTLFSCRTGFSLWKLLKLSNATWKHNDFSLPWEVAINFVLFFNAKFRLVSGGKNRKTNMVNKTETLCFRCLLLGFYF